MKRYFIIAMLLLLPAGELVAKEDLITFTDSSAREISFQTRPERVVSLVPSVTEMLLELGVEKELLGVTLHDIRPAAVAGKAVLGGFFNPDLDRVAALKPDTIFYSDIQDGLVERFEGKARLIHLSVTSIDQSFEHIRLLGQIFDRRERAEEIIVEQQRQLALIKNKIEQIPPGERLRTVRLMGWDKVMVPGDNSFQNEYIEMAGGIAPQFGKEGSIIEPDLAGWQEFNPQVIYGCGDDREGLALFSESAWGNVDAVKNNRIIFFPCELTCRASTHTGYFVSWLAAKLYWKHFSDPRELVLPAGVVERKPVQLDFDYVEKAERLYSDILDFRHKSLVIKLNNPMTILSTLEGWRQDINYVGNHYFPPPSWGLGHDDGLDGLKKRTFAALKLDEKESSMLFTGADMDNLAIATAHFKDMKVTAIVTAGVKSNALRMGKDVGGYYELDKFDDRDKKKKPGTINTILLTNTRLSKRAMTRALVSAVEGKSAALQDQDIRSTPSPAINPATGTGTDNILVVQGSGPEINASGGHTKMGELIARAVYDGVTEAIAKQNGITSKRSIFARLDDRKISSRQLSREHGRALDKLLLEPEYSSFIAAAFAISDQYERGLITDLGSFDSWCREIAEQIAGGQVEVRELTDQQQLLQKQPLVMRKAFGALINGISGLQRK